MSLKAAAQYLESQGRGNDSRLMHVTPSELRGLQALAMAKGGSLTINPHTGLPEAGFLEDVLPVAAAGALMFLAPEAAPFIGEGLGLGTGALGTGVGMGLLAGGAQAATQLLTTGNVNLGSAARTGLISGATAGALKGFDMMPTSNVKTETPALNLSASAPTIPGADVSAPTITTPNIVEGPKNVVTSAPGYGVEPPGGFANAQQTANFMQGETGQLTPQSLYSSQNPASITPDPSKPWTTGQKVTAGLGGITALSLLAGANQPKIQTPATTSYIRPYTYTQTRNPYYGQPGQNYYTQSYTAQPTYKAAEGGLMAIGDNPLSGPVERMSQSNAGEGTYPQAFLDRSTYAVPSQMPTSAEVVQSDYDANTDPYTGDLKRMASGGSADAGYIPTSQAVQDYNKMLSQRAVDEYINSPMPTALMPSSQRQALQPTGPATIMPVNEPAIGQDINGLYQYYLGRQPSADEAGQWAGQINGPVTPDMANYFSQFTGGELAKTGYKPQGPNPFLGQAGLPMGGQMGGSLAAQAGLPQYAYNAATRSYAPIAQQMAPVAQAPVAVAAPSPMDGSNGGAAGGLMPNSLRYDRGGKTEGENMFEGLSEKEKRSMLMDMISAKLDSPQAQYVEGLGFMTPPPSVGGRLGANMDALGGNLRAGVSGNVMQAPDKKIVANPGMMDIGYASKRESAYDPFYDVSLQRAIKSAPGRGRDYAVAANYTMPFAQGGQAGYNLGGYSDGGRLLKGPGDGMSDNIPASIGDKQPARLADGEFVVPADVVSHLGNGSTDAGAKKLYAMMDKVRTARVGTKKQGKQIKAEKYLPA